MEPDSYLDSFTLPIRLGGLGLVNPCRVSHSNFKALEQSTSPLVSHVIAQCATQNVNHDQMHQLKRELKPSGRRTESSSPLLLIVFMLNYLYPCNINDVLTWLGNLDCSLGRLFCHQRGTCLSSP